MANTDKSQDQKSKAGEQSHKTKQQGGKTSGDQMKQDDSKSRGTQGGTHEQHVNAGKQSHKNS